MGNFIHLRWLLSLQRNQHEISIHMRHNIISSQHINLFRVIIIKGVLSKKYMYQNRRCMDTNLAGGLALDKLIARCNFADCLITIYI